MAAIIIFFVAHWFLSIFAQSFFLHRYTAHGMFRMSKFWEKFFYLFTFAAQGSSFLHPKAYAQLHMEHHTHSDTEKDPHSPHFFKDLVGMMANTFRVYLEFRTGKRRSKSPYIEKLKTWPTVDAIGNSFTVRIGFCLLYTWFYIAFAPSFWWYLLLPVHYFMGPVHGAFINWCGHKYGYRNYDTGDQSKNTFLWDILFMGETFQNNHHRYPNRPNFATRWYEWDGLYPALWLFNRLRIIRLKS